tara:strand:+ start:1008 stop:1856 length:849 start_codon:yes stop_codon:yes gene_type:complete
MKFSKNLVIGSNGLLGSEIVKQLKKKKICYFTIARKKSDFNLDLEKYNKLEEFFKKNNFLNVINCAAKISIDYCEKNYRKAIIINYNFPKYLTKLSMKYNFKLVHISSDHVYKGKKFKLNSEKSKLFPINKYALSKILAEKVVKINKKNLIIRTNFTGRKNDGNSFIDWLDKNIKKKNTIKLFNDMYTSTIDVKTCAKIIVDLIISKSSGIYNLGSKDVISKKEFAIKYAGKIRKKIKFISESCDDLNVPRGKNLGLNVKKIEKKLNIKMPTSSKVIKNLVL